MLRYVFKINMAACVTAVLPVNSGVEGVGNEKHANSIVPIRRKYVQLDWLLK